MNKESVTQIHFRINSEKLRQAKSICYQHGIRLNNLLRFVTYNIAKSKKIPLQIKKVE